MKKETILKSFFLFVFLIFSSKCFLTSCGKEEPVTENEKIEEENHENDHPYEPAEELPSEDNPDTSGGNEGGSSKYYTPKKEDLLGPWCVCWEKCDDWVCISGKWVMLGSDIWSEEDGHERYSGFPYYLALFEYSWLDSTVDRLIWDRTAVTKYYSILSALENGENAKFGYPGTVNVENGNLDGDYYKWEWQPEINGSRNMLILLDKNKNVRCRWEISKFDGETFILTDYFKDWRNSKNEGASNYDYTRMYRRMSEIVNDADDSSK